MTRRIAAHVPPIHVLSLYAATLVAEVPVIFARMLVILVVVVVFRLVKGQPLSGVESVMNYALVATGWSIFALVTPFGGGWWWRQNMGGREPSERERVAYNDALELLRHDGAEPLRLPSSWFVIDSPQPDAAVCGSALMLSRGLLEGEHVAAVLAHELGHLASTDGRLTAALNRLVIHPPPGTAEEQRRRPEIRLVADDRVLLTITVLGALLWLLRKTVAFAKGGFGLKLTAFAWGSYWREREYVADEYAAELGQAEELADFLEVHVLVHDHPVPFIWLTEHSHPPTELRVDRLRKTARAQPSVPAPSLEGVRSGQPHLPAA